MQWKRGEREREKERKRKKEKKPLNAQETT
jgi:hypothetical protein